MWQKKGDLDMVVTTTTKKTRRCGVGVGQHVQHTVSVGTSNGCETFFLSVSGGAIGTVSTREYSLYPSEWRLVCDHQELVGMHSADVGAPERDREPGGRSSPDRPRHPRHG